MYICVLFAHEIQFGAIKIANGQKFNINQIIAVRYVLCVYVAVYNTYIYCHCYFTAASILFV